MDPSSQNQSSPSISPPEQKQKNSIFSLTALFILFMIIVIILVLYILFILFKNTDKKTQTKDNPATNNAVKPPPKKPIKQISFRNIQDPLASGPSEFKSLEVSDTDASAINQNIGKFTNLNEIYLERDNLTEIPESLLSKTNLTTLWLPNNKITSIPSKIVELKNLKILNLVNNKISVIPKEVGLLTNLEELYLSNNAIKSIPAEMGNLKNLKELYLEANLLSEAEAVRLKSLLPNTKIFLTGQNK